MRKILLITIFIFTASQLPAQKSFQKNTLYAEIMGSGVVLSANYERQLSDEPGFGLYIGAGLGGDKPAIPLGAKYLYDIGGKRKSFIETGAGIVLAEEDVWDDSPIPVQKDKNPYKVAFVPCIGYRHHTPYGLMWRINYTPVFSSYRNIPLFGGVSIGWRL